MATVRSDLIQDSKAQRNENGWIITRSIIVEGLSGSPSSILIQAIQFCGVAYGQSHPNEPNFIAKNFDASALSNSVASVKVTYSKFELGGGDAPVIEYRGSLTSELLDDDLDNPGKPMYVYHWADGSKAGNFGDASGRQGAAINVLRPVGNLFVSRYLTLSNNDTGTLKALVDNYLGKVNNSIWQNRAKHEWLCSDVQVVRMGTSNQYRVSLTFSFRPKGWDCWARYVDPYTGKPPANAKKDEATPKKSNGFAKFRGYQEVDFSALYTVLGNF